ncbi:cell division protein FtsL [Nitrosomonadaceae bacterium]|nr:cell division protein FtsL [Nitrosomonadaceae bacterium]
MTRLNIFLILIMIVCGLSIVTSQHRARKLFSELEEEQKLAEQLTIEWGKLQLEQSTWAMRSRVERIATKHLLMRVPDAPYIQTISLIDHHNLTVLGKKLDP